MSTNGGKNGAFIEMLNAPDKHMGKSKNFMTLLARRILFDMGINTRQYFAYIERWLKRKYKDVDKHVQQISVDRNNFYKEMGNDSMTPNVFQKFTQSLGAERVTLSVTLEFSDGRPRQTTTVSFVNNVEPTDETSTEGENKDDDKLS